MTERLALSPALSDEQARQQALSPLASFVVQAPAGAGKTELLTQRYLRLLSTVERPEQILAITFTRKAANEMRNRILQALTRVRMEARPLKAHEAQTWDLAQAALATDAARGWQLETHPARLRIQTIDALNAGLSRRLPVLSGTGAAMEIAQDTRPIYEAVCQGLLEGLGDGSATSEQLQTVLLHLANRVSTLTDMVCELLAKRDQWLPLLIGRREDTELRANLETTLGAAIEHHLRGLHASLPQALHEELIELVTYSIGNRRRDGLKLDTYLEACGDLTVLPLTSTNALHAWRGIASVVLKKDGEFYASLTKTQGFPTDNKQAKQRMLALLETLREIPGLEQMFHRLHVLPAPRFSDAQWQVLGALLHLLPDAVDKLHLEFQARGQVDYVELSLRALQALGPPEEPTDLALALDENTRHILVDEFQDTSFTQMALLNALTAGWSEGDGRTLFCVGDPMQSIYRFRQAEVGLFLDLQTRGLPTVGMSALRLQTNFRSAQPVVDWVNRSFPQLLPPADDSELGAVKYSASRPRTDAPSVGEVRVHAGIARSALEEAQEIGELIKIAAADSDNKRIAVLVGNRSHAGPIAQALKQAGIEFRAVDIERLQDRPLVQDLMSLTRALSHLGDRTAWLACLRAPWCGLTLADLHALAANEPDRTVWSLLCDEAGLARLSTAGQVQAARFKRVLQAALDERGRCALRDWIERCWLALNGPAVLQSANELDDAEAFFERLDALSVAGDLEDIARLEEQLSDLFANSRTQNEARVEIMTVHKSKGLEFDVVILPSLHRPGGRNGKALLRWARLNGLNADGLILAPVTAQGQEPDSIYQWLSDLETRRTELERGRLLYVAATRAKRELHLFGSVKPKKNGEELGKPPAGTLLNLLWPQVETQFQTAFDHYHAKPVALAGARSVPFKRLPADWTPPEPDAAAQGAAPPLNINTEFERLDFDWVGEVSRHVGTVTHAELERLVKLSREDIQQWNAATRRPELMLQLAELGVPAALRDTACRRIIAAIEHTLNDARGRWILGLDMPHRDAISELALSGVVDRILVNSVIDRSFVDEEGTRWIIDFKTSSHEGGGREAFLANEEARYRPQLMRYAKLMSIYKPKEPIRTALYFPLLGEWREVEIS